VLGEMIPPLRMKSTNVNTILSKFPVSSTWMAMEGKMVVKKRRKNTSPKRARSSVVDDVHERIRRRRLEHQEGENDDDSDGTIDMLDADDVDSNF
jgi:hypothetical protein